MSDRETDFVFDGVSDLTSGRFLRIVRQNALDKEKGTDDQWIALYAAAHMDGPALDWLEEQDEEMQESWKLLRRALLLRWPTTVAGADTRIPEASVPSSRTMIPTPAAAPPTQITIAPSKLIPSVTPTVKTGRIRLVAFTGVQAGYLSKSLDGDGDYQSTKSISEAQTVHFMPPAKPHEVYLGSSGLSATNGLLGYTMQSDEFGILAVLSLVRPSGWPRKKPRLESSSTDFDGDSHAIMWCVLLDGTMVPSWEENTGSKRVRHDLDIALGTTMGSITLAADFDEHKKGDPGWTAEKGRFVFESFD